ncbi:MAG: serine protease [Verrucomicrobiales bacterium]|nr:serine protease [Verrucomicrobiales bacterium]
MLLILACAGPVLGENPPNEMDVLYRRCQASCVEVLIDGRHAGSGWFASPDGFVVTACHLLGDTADSRIELLSGDDSRIPATRVAVDRGHDLALLRTASRRGPGQWLPLASQVPGIGETLFQYGAPLYRSGVLQSGRIASERTAYEYYGDLHEYVEVMHVSGMMQGGTSGGPWLNGRGEVVGLQSGVMSMEGRPVGIAYLVPAEFLRVLLQTTQDVQTPSLGLGVDELWQQSGEFLRKLPEGTEGLVVAVLQGDGPAAKAGLRVQDVIVSVDGGKVIRIREFLRKIRAHRPGDTVTLGVLTPGSPDVVQRAVVLGRAER